MGVASSYSSAPDSTYWGNYGINCFILSPTFYILSILSKHSILLTRLQHRFGISGKAWKWLASYLEDRTQFVSVNNFNSTTSTVKYGVPQGFVLGPLLFSLYDAPLKDIFKAHAIVMTYADDTQLYLVVKPGDRAIHNLRNVCKTSELGLLKIN